MPGGARDLVRRIFARPEQGYERSLPEELDRDAMLGWRFVGGHDAGASAGAVPRSSPSLPAVSCLLSMA